MRRAAKRDESEAAIVDALRRIGVVVFRLNDPSLPDTLLYDARGRCHLGNPWLAAEIKTGKGRLTPAQQITFTVAPFPILRTVAEALNLYGVELPK